MRVRKRIVESAVANWTTLNAALSGMNEEEVFYALKLESEREIPRKTFVKRLKQRYAGIRAEAVKKEMKR